MVAALFVLVVPRNPRPPELLEALDQIPVPVPVFEALPDVCHPESALTVHPPISPFAGSPLVPLSKLGLVRYSNGALKHVGSGEALELTGEELLGSTMVEKVVGD